MSARTLAALAATLTTAALAPAASANVGVVTCTPDGVEVTLTGWRDAVVTLDDLTVSAGESVLRSGPHSFRGPSATVLLPTGPIGSVRVEVIARVAGRSWTNARVVSCPTVPAPPVPVAPPAPPAGEAAPPPPSVTPPRPRVSAPKRRSAPPRRITCRYLIRVGAGPRSFAARGYYPGCRAPRPRPAVPAVTG